MIKRFLTGAFLLSLLICLPALSARAVAVEAVEAGPWSAWQEEPILPTNTLEVEAGNQTIDQVRTVFEYRRYVYYNKDKSQWFCAPDEQTGGHVAPGSGYFETNRSETPLPLLSSGDEPCYEGGWYHETPVDLTESKTAYCYRSRSVRRVTCELSTRELLLFPDKTGKITANLFDGDANYHWSSSDESVCSVDSQGNVTAHAFGTAILRIRSSSGREVSCEVMVCQKNASIPDGVYTLRLGETQKTLTIGKNLSTERRRAYVANYEGTLDQRFLLTNIGEGRTFVLSTLSDKRFRVDIARGKSAPAAGNPVQAHQKKDRAAQSFRAVAVPDGSYILYPRANARLVLGAEPLEAGNGVRMEALGDLSFMDRWVLVKTGQTVTPSDAFQRPVIRDGLSYVAADYDPGTESPLRFESNGRRVFVLSAARGKVLSVYRQCAHDYGKTPDDSGMLSDPCGALGNTVTIDHGGGNVFTYAHLSEVYVEAGDEVFQSSMIGRSGATGRVPGVCLSLIAAKDGVAFDPRALIDLPELNKSIG